MRAGIALIITILVVIAALWLGRRPDDGARRPPKPQEASPEQRLEAMFTAAEQGDVPAYIDCFCEGELAKVERDRASQGDAAFAQSLRDAIRSMKGRAIYAPEFIRDDTAEVRVERI